MDRLAPANVEAEQALLGSILIDPSAVVRVGALVAADDFSRPAHGQIFAAVVALYSRREAVDIVTVLTELERRGAAEETGGAAYLTSLIERTPVAAHVEHYAGLVARAAMRRRLIDAAGEIARIAYEDEAETIDETVDKAESAIFRVLGERRRGGLVSVADLLDQYYERIEEIQRDQESMVGVGSGFKDLDRTLGGMQPSDLIIVAGRPGMGKTSWLTSVASNVAMTAGKTVALFSLEMSGDQMVQRLISAETGISTHKLRVGDISFAETEMIMRAIGRLAPMNLYIDDTPGISPFELRTKVRRLAAEKGVDLVIVDYLQLMQSGGRNENRVQEISLISRSLKGLAREVRVPVIAASQLSRAVESRADRRPQLSDLRESGAIEQDADMVLFLYRDVVYNEDTEKKNIAEIIVAKHRHGPTGTVELIFVPHETRFRDLATGYAEVPAAAAEPVW
ncbi:MAG: replicative DNA helicase [Ardenticatenia bacterium]|nr:replicative DNA helicase [Ardenticatenia bacterium]